MSFHPSSQAARTAFVEICALADSDTAAEEQASLSIGREFLPEHARKVLDKRDLTAREEREYYEWLTENVQTAIDEHEARYAAECESFGGEGPNDEDRAYGYSFWEWLRAAGRSDSASHYDLRAAWRAGEKPSDYAIFPDVGGPIDPDGSGSGD